MSTENLVPMAFEFSASSHQVRTLVLENEPWFVVKDVCEVLEHTNASVAIKMLDDDERCKKSLGRQGMSWLVNESGLYTLILRSNKPEAKAFRKWITAEVLPAIRKKGRYDHTVKKAYSDYIDARATPYTRQLLNGHEVRVISHDGVVFYSIPDVHRALGVTTGTHQVAEKLNKKGSLAVKIWVYGNTNPSWFATEDGLRLILLGSRTANASMQVKHIGQTQINFDK